MCQLPCPNSRARACEICGLPGHMFTSCPSKEGKAKDGKEKGKGKGNKGKDAKKGKAKEGK